MVIAMVMVIGMVMVVVINIFIIVIRLREQLETSQGEVERLEQQATDLATQVTLVIMLETTKMVLTVLLKIFQKLKIFKVLLFQYFQLFFLSRWNWQATQGFKQNRPCSRPGGS